MEKEHTEEIKTIGATPRFKKSYIIIASVVALFLIIGALLYNSKGLFIAATINGSPISRLSVIRELEKRAAKTVLDSLIDERLINDEFAKKSIAVSDEEVEGEIAKIEERVKSQGGVLEAALESEGITRDDFKKQILIQIKLQKILGDIVKVTDEEVEQYIAGTGSPLPKGHEEEVMDQVRQNLTQQKFSKEAAAWVAAARSAASIRYFADY